MSDDLIRRSDAIKAIEDVDWYHINSRGEMVSGATSEMGAWYKADDVYKALEEVPSADRPQGWISCSERLPNKYKAVLTTSKDGRVRENFINVGGWSYDTYAVVAWMPLPKPWKGADDDGIDR